ncbi:MAG: pyridoxamine 5'-phosphate oxidase family protein [Anaerolineaceae bacterium]|nr:pyridoxamine 5'-phosphate oxidase family protein [Anaerolineaceae bacterium]
MAVKIPAEVKAFMTGKQGWVATASKDGIPNIAIKGSLRVMDDEHLLFADLFSLKTRKNLEENPKVAVMVFDPETRKGYSLKGQAEMISSGPIYDQMVEILKQAPMKFPPPKYAVKITVEAVYDQSVGPEAGKQIA